MDKDKMKALALAADLRDLLDEEGENQAVRTFLMQYSCDRSITVGAMLAHMSMSGWRGTAPAFALECRPEMHLTKAGAQIWLRHLFSQEGNKLLAENDKLGQERDELRAEVERRKATESEKDSLIEKARFALEVMLKHFTKTPSTLADSTARSGAHQALMAIGAHTKAGKPAPDLNIDYAQLDALGRHERKV